MPRRPGNTSDAGGKGRSRLTGAAAAVELPAGGAARRAPRRPRRRRSPTNLACRGWSTCSTGRSRRFPTSATRSGWSASLPPRRWSSSSSNSSAASFPTTARCSACSSCPASWSSSCSCSSCSPGSRTGTSNSCSCPPRSWRGSRSPSSSPGRRGEQHRHRPVPAASGRTGVCETGQRHARNCCATNSSRARTMPSIAATSTRRPITPMSNCASTPR